MIWGKVIKSKVNKIKFYLCEKNKEILRLQEKVKRLYKI